MAGQHYENFPVASWVCPPHLRAPIAAIYSFARTADDIADEGDASPAERLTRLAAYRADLALAARGEAVSPQWPGVFEQVAPLPAVGSRRVLAQEPDALASFFVVEAVVEPVEVEVYISSDGPVVFAVPPRPVDDLRRRVGPVVRTAQQLTEAAQGAVATLVERAARADAHRSRVLSTEAVGERRRWHRCEQLLPVLGLADDGHVVRAQRGGDLGRPGRAEVTADDRHAPALRAGDEEQLAVPVSGEQRELAVLLRECGGSGEGSGIHSEVRSGGQRDAVEGRGVVLHDLAYGGGVDVAE